MVVICQLGLRTVLILAMAANGATSLTAAENSQGAIITGSAEAKDGDSVWLGSGRVRLEVRLHGIDAPEYDQKCKDKGGEEWSCGTEATRALGSLVNGRQLRCEVTDVDIYGRPIVKCFDADINISVQMLSVGGKGVLTLDSETLKKEDLRRR
jgi:endonuclease YncB( thermonuclease family)